MTIKHEYKADKTKVQKVKCFISIAKQAQIHRHQNCKIARAHPTVLQDPLSDFAILIVNVRILLSA